MGYNIAQIEYKSKCKKIFKNLFSNFLKIHSNAFQMQQLLVGKFSYKPKVCTIDPQKSFGHSEG